MSEGISPGEEEGYLSLSYPYEFVVVSPLFVFRLLMGMVILTLSNTYVWFFVLSITPGWKRFFAAVPLLTFFFFYPILLFRQKEDFLLVCMSVFYVTWLGGLRVIGLSFGVGRLAHETRMFPFYLSLFSPFRVVPTNYVGDPDTPSPKIQDGFLSLVKGTTKFYLLILFIYISYYIGDGFVQRSITYGAVVYYGASYVSDLSSAIASLFFGLVLMPSFSAPFLCTSLSDFWGKRWNLTYSALHYELIFQPIERYFAARNKKKLGQAIGVVMTFLVTGFFMELVMTHVSGKVSLEWFTFFVLQIVGIFAERVILGAFGKHIPRRVYGILSLLYLMITADLYLWPPMLRVGFAEAIF
eukprot:CAMPEP_0201526992 /NCGR_PEP_ID=MMETSP0161_2-20130828/33629_1 /ASSEMBLY_ACC=CAM_ASM_000251 /TAXON_ID=180227 /ORGANISM="Neoparamoeba aestuarina, Strain SoJaBio B1-5/56/2" /LENGTH=354 /DNA_ID=CAMNT_0047927607 /DNA_START=147 /DNA_END=1208 /DNA_ORIENTATION=-